MLTLAWIYFVSHYTERLPIAHPVIRKQPINVSFCKSRSFSKIQNQSIVDEGYLLHRGFAMLKIYFLRIVEKTETITLAWAKQSTTKSYYYYCVSSSFSPKTDSHWEFLNEQYFKCILEETRYSLNFSDNGILKHGWSIIRHDSNA